MQQSTQTGRLELINIFTMAPLSYLPPHSLISIQFPPNVFHRLKLGPLSPTRFVGKTLGRICTWRFKEKILEISLKRHLNIIEILWVAHVHGGGKLKEKTLEISLKRHLNIIEILWVTEVL